MSLPLNYKLMLILFKIEGYNDKDLKENGLKIEIEIEPIMKSYCPNCALSDKRYDSSILKIYIGSVLTRPFYACLRVYRIECPDCGILTD